MSRELYINDFDRIKDHRARYPLAGKIFEQPNAFWFGTKHGKKTSKQVESRARRLMKRVGNLLPVIVVYNLPNRDLGSYSAGGANSYTEYAEYVDALCTGLGDHAAIIIYEPDALAHSTQQPWLTADARHELMHDSLQTIVARTKADVYVDIGHSNWLSPEIAGRLLNRVSPAGIRGFSINVSNFRTTAESIAWGDRVAAYACNKNYVIDTSRNGLGPHGNDWCNPPSRALGSPPTFTTDSALCDAYLWIKVPGESDGKCNGGPAAGRFWLEYARELVDNTEWLL